jgi:hypothetical protein
MADFPLPPARPAPSELTGPAKRVEDRGPPAFGRAGRGLRSRSV